MLKLKTITKHIYIKTDIWPEIPKPAPIKPIWTGSIWKDIWPETLGSIQGLDPDKLNRYGQVAFEI